MGSTVGVIPPMSNVFLGDGEKKSLRAWAEAVEAIWKEFTRPARLTLYSVRLAQCDRGPSA